MTRHHDPDWYDPDPDEQDHSPQWRGRADLTAEIIEKLVAVITILIAARAHHGSWRNTARAALRHITRK